MTRLLHIPTGGQAAAWQAARDTFDRFAAAEHYLFSVPMWNAGVPYVLKQFIDVVSQPRFQPNLATADPDAGRRAAHAEARDLGKAF